MAGGRIKGITIEIGGDTTPLQKALSGVNKDLKQTQSQLRDVNKLLKLDPKNTELLRQKQELLGKAIGDSEEKLAKLKEASEQMAKGGITDQNRQQYEALQREIIATEQEIKKLKAEQDKLAGSKLDNLGRQFDEVGKKISSIGDNLAKKVTVPLLAVGTASMAAFADVDKGMDAVVKKTGATGDQLAEMQASVKNLGTEIPASFEDIGSAVGEVNTRFGLTGQELEDLSAQFLKFARLNDTDVVNSIDDVQKALAAYGLDASSAGEYLDVLNATAQATGVDVNKLAQGIISNGAAFQEMGLDINQATYFMGQLEKSGANSETVLNGMRKALKNSAADGKDLNESLAELEDTILNGKDGVDGLQKSYELFGKSGDQIYAALKTGSLSFKDLGDAAIEAGGSIDGTFANTLDATDDMKLTFNALKEAGYEVGAALGKTLTPILKKAAEGLRKFSQWFEKLSPKTKDLITKLGLLAAAAGPVLSIAGRITSKVGSLIKSAPKLISGVKGLVTALATNPYLAIAAGAAAAVAGITALILSQNKITREYEKAKKAREEEIQGAYTQAATAEIYAQKLDELSQKENKSAADKQLMKTYVDQLNGSVEGLNLQYDAENDKLNQSTSKIYEKIDAYKQQVIQQAYANQMQQVANDLVQTEMELDDVRAQKKQANADLEKAIAEGNIDQQNYLIAKIKDLDNTESQLQAKQTGLMTELDKYADKASGSVEKVETKMSSAATNAGSDGANLGMAFADGIAQGIANGEWSAINAATKLMADAIAAAKKAGKISSPSKVTRDLIGKNLALGVGVGMLDELSTVEKDAEKFMNGTINAMISQPPQMQVAGMSTVAKSVGSIGSASGPSSKSVNQTINIYQPVSTPAETARAIRQQEIVQGLAG